MLKPTNMIYFKPMHIMVFGGSFDPPHNGHLAIASYVLSNKLCDKVWFVPCGSHPFDKKFSDAKHRVEMLTQILIPNTEISTYEIEKEGKSFSFDTLNYFSKTFPSHTFSFLMGSDQLVSFHKWANFERMTETYNIYVYPRTNYPFNPMYPNMIKLENAPVIPVSSTDIRTAVRNGVDCTSKLSSKTLDYITKHSLYNN